MCGSWRPPASRISRPNRSADSSWLSSGARTFTTTSRPSCSSRATKTRAIPPPPRSRAIVYAPPSDDWSWARSASVTVPSPLPLIVQGGDEPRLRCTGVEDEGGVPRLEAALRRGRLESDADVWTGGERGDARGERDLAAVEVRPGADRRLRQPTWRHEGVPPLARAHPPRVAIAELPAGEPDARAGARPRTFGREMQLDRVGERQRVERRIAGEEARQLPRGSLERRRARSRERSGSPARVGAGRRRRLARAADEECEQRGSE